jgi:hypothetical protein
LYEISVYNTIPQNGRELVKVVYVNEISTYHTMPQNGRDLDYIYEISFIETRYRYIIQGHKMGDISFTNKRYHLEKGDIGI